MLYFLVSTDKASLVLIVFNGVLYEVCAYTASFSK